MPLDLCLSYLQLKVELQKVKIHKNNYGNVSKSPGCGTCCGIFNVPSYYGFQFTVKRKKCNHIIIFMNFHSLKL